MEYIEQNWKKLLLYLLATILIVGGVWYFFQWQERMTEQLHKAQQLQEEQLQSITALKDKLSISQDNATALAGKIDKINTGQVQPSVSFTVQAPNVQKAADSVQERINSGDTTLPTQAIENTDRTVVTPITSDSEQKVDVYKINLRKDHRIKAGISAVGGKAYLTIGYEQGRVEGLIHFDGVSPDGATILYNVAEW